MWEVSEKTLTIEEAEYDTVLDVTDVVQTSSSRSNWTDKEK